MRLHSWGLAFLICICATAGVTAQQSRIGLKLGVQPWTPLINDSTVQFVLDDPGRVSDALNQGWRAYSGLLATAIKASLGQADLVADGITFYDIDLQLNQPLLTITRLDGSGIPGDPYHAAVEIQLNNEGVTMSATQPTVVGSYGDPRCSAEFDAIIKLDLVIQNTVGAAFSSPQTQEGSAPVARITRFDFDSHNLICDFAVGLIKILGLKDTISQVIAQDSGLANKPLAQAGRNLISSAIATLNGLVASYQRPEINLVILRAWLVDQAGGGKTIVLNLAPRAPLPDPSAGQGGLGGVITAAGAQGINTGQNGQIDCTQLPVTVDRITGPQPMTSPLGTLGGQPLEALAVRTDCGPHVLLPGQRATYRISGMSALFPQIVRFGSVRGKCVAYEAGVHQGIDIKATWTQGLVLPQELYSSHDLTANFMSLVCGGQASTLFDKADHFLKYLLDQQAINPNPLTLSITKEYMRSRGLSELLLGTLPVLAEPTQIRSATPPAPTPPPPPAPAGCTPNRYTDTPARARTGKSVNIRAGDSTDCAVVGQLQAGRAVGVLSCTLANGRPSKWCRIEFGTEGAVGFVFRQYLAFDASRTTLPSGDAEPSDEVIVLDVPNGSDPLPDGTDPNGDGLPGDSEGSPDNMGNNFPDPQSDLPPDAHDEQPDAIDPCLVPRLKRYCPSSEE